MFASFAVEEHPDDAGIDEAGCGCLFGDLCAAAVVIPASVRENEPEFLAQLKDSKRLTAQKRQVLASSIFQRCLVGIGVVTSMEINEMGLGIARRLVFHRALDELAKQHTPRAIIVDGTLFDPYHNVPHACIPKADACFKHVAAASIVAKTTRDTNLLSWCKEHPEVAVRYDLQHNKGYITVKHKEAIAKYGRTGMHRNYNIK